MILRHPQRTILFALLGIALSVLPAGAQELVPRRWSHLPTGMNFAGAGYAYTSGEIGFDPVLLIENVELSMHTVATKYIRTFEMFDRSARFDFTQAYHDARWEGLLDGVPAEAVRSGFGDTILRLSTNLIGAPPLQGKDFAAYRASHSERETIVGAALAVHLPTGHYLEDRLLNLGANRFTIRPQLGVVHNRGNWSMELTGAAWIHSENDDFFNGNRLQQDPLYTIQSHLVYTFRPGLWIGAGAAYGTGGTSTLNDIEKDDKKSNLAFGVSLGYPITPKFGVSVGYIGMRTQEDVGSDLNTFTAGFSLLW
jgi:hypothetical protein